MRMQWRRCKKCSTSNAWTSVWVCGRASVLTMVLLEGKLEFGGRSPSRVGSSTYVLRVCEAGVRAGSSVTTHEDAG